MIEVSNPGKLIFPADGFTKADQHEWHGNTFSVEWADGEEKLGSLLYTLRRAPLNASTCRLAEHFCAIALQPLVRQKKASSFSVEATSDKSLGVMHIHIKAYTPEERNFFADLYALR